MTALTAEITPDSLVEHLKKKHTPAMGLNICLAGLFFLILSVSTALAKAPAEDPALHPAAGTRAINPDLFVNAETLKRQERSGSLPMLIDVRNSNDFNAFRIPGSVNLPLFAVKTKSMFKSGPIVLFNEGYNNSPLIWECEKLRKNGFDAAILFGGLMAWKNSNGAVEGDYFELKTARQIPGRIWFSEQKNDCWVCVDASSESTGTDPDKTGQTIFPKAFRIPYAEPAEPFARQVAQAVKTRETSSRFYALMVFTQDGRAYPAIEKALNDFPCLFFLKDGLAGYKSFLKDLELARTQKRTIKGKKCGSCPK